MSVFDHFSKNCCLAFRTKQKVQQGVKKYQSIHKTTSLSQNANWPLEWQHFRCWSDFFPGIITAKVVNWFITGEWFTTQIVELLASQMIEFQANYY